jgi:NADPH-dependent 2,4-dienoyl-CoA reductase/sulfur reductase-like enzyme
VRAELARHQVDIHTDTIVVGIEPESDRLRVQGDCDFSATVDVVLVSVGVRPSSGLAADAGPELGARGTVRVGTGRDRVAGEKRRRRPAVVRPAPSAPRSLRSSISQSPAPDSGTTRHATPASTRAQSPTAPPDHRPYYPTAHELHMRWSADADTDRLLGCQIAGHRAGQVAKRIDTAATAIFADLTIDQINDLDLSYSPPFGSPSDALQIGAQALCADRCPAHRPALAASRHEHPDR